MKNPKKFYRDDVDSQSNPKEASQGNENWKSTDEESMGKKASGSSEYGDEAEKPSSRRSEEKSGTHKKSRTDFHRGGNGPYH